MDEPNPWPCLVGSACEAFEDDEDGNWVDISESSGAGSVLIRVVPDEQPLNGCC